MIHPRTAAKKLRQRLKRYLHLRRARHSRRGSEATVVAVTGSSGKSTTTALISHILAELAPVKSQVGRNLLSDCVKTLASTSADCRYLVCETGSDGPGSLKPMLDLLKPSVGIVTLVGLEHKRAFHTLEGVAKEKQTMVEVLPERGLAILNYDDARVAVMASHTKARVATFGVTGGDYVISAVQCPAPGQLSFSIAHEGERFDLTTPLTGVHNYLPVAAAFACAHQLGAPPSLIQERIADFAPLYGRCSVHRIENGPIFIADTNKAPYYSIHLAINMMAHFEAPRKRIVIGQISDANSTEARYRQLYKACRAVADQVVFVGENAHRSKASAEDIATGGFVAQPEIQQAARFLKETAIPGEIILLKSSPRYHLERLLLSFQTTVRCWPARCRKRIQCVECGLYETPFESSPEGRKQLLRMQERAKAELE
jgi:UDP-N-acetylmuramoyl-tripeptide--D-alanyl-D-alanine ligase